MTTADERSLSIYPSGDIVVTTGNPVKVAIYVTPARDERYLWNDERSDRIGESINSRYLPPESSQTWRGPRKPQCALNDPAGFSL